MSYSPGQVRSIQTISFTFASSPGTQTFSLTTAVLDPTKCVVVRFYRTSGVSGFHYTGDQAPEVTSTTQFQVTGATGEAIAFKIQIVEYVTPN